MIEFRKATLIQPKYQFFRWLSTPNEEGIVWDNVPYIFIPTIRWGYEFNKVETNFIIHDSMPELVDRWIMGNTNPGSQAGFSLCSRNGVFYYERSWALVSTGITIETDINYHLTADLATGKMNLNENEIGLASVPVNRYQEKVFSNGTAGQAHLPMSFSDVIYSLDGVEICHLKPCKHYGESGMYDIISETFYNPVCSRARLYDLNAHN